jgi:hypothetical protein
VVVPTTLIDSKGHYVDGLMSATKKSYTRIFTGNPDILIHCRRVLSFLKKSALEHAIQLVSEEVHRPYVLSFEPKGGKPGEFHTIRVAVKDRPELHSKTRDGYWALP